MIGSAHHPPGASGRAGSPCRRPRSRPTRSRAPRSRCARSSPLRAVSPTDLARRGIDATHGAAEAVGHPDEAAAREYADRLVPHARSARRPGWPTPGRCGSRCRRRRSPPTAARLRPRGPRVRARPERSTRCGLGPASRRLTVPSSVLVTHTTPSATATLSGLLTHGHRLPGRPCSSVASSRVTAPPAELATHTVLPFTVMPSGPLPAGMVATTLGFVTSPAERPRRTRTRPRRLRRTPRQPRAAPGHGDGPQAARRAPRSGGPGRASARGSAPAAGGARGGGDGGGTGAGCRGRGGRATARWREAPRDRWPGCAPAATGPCRSSAARAARPRSPAEG